MTPPAGPIRAVIARALLTMAVGYEKGYHVITLSDCLAATSMEEHENAIKLNYPMFSEDEIAGLRRAAGRRGDPTALA